MINITFVSSDGEAIPVQANTGETVMLAALVGAVEGIEAECGGGCSCATCHVIVPEAWATQTGEPEPLEAAMLEGLAGRRPGSRLSCQIRVEESLDGLVVHVPPGA